jgi:8-oxo-dGTP pyrophosphatase MutT (NUDIX family)
MSVEPAVFDQVQQKETDDETDDDAQRDHGACPEKRNVSQGVERRGAQRKADRRPSGGSDARRKGHGAMLKPLYAAFRPLVHLAIRAKSGVTLGVRVVPIAVDGRIGLVRHTYLPGWYLPGGGVDPGETALDGALRELREELAVSPRETPELFGLYANFREFPDNHVALYVARDLDPVDRVPDAEIAEVAWFPRAAIPAEATDATRRRLAEALDDAPVDPAW